MKPEIVTAIISGLLGGGLVSALVGAWSNHGIEAFKAEITRKNERFKAESSIELERLKRRFSIVAEKQAQAAEDVYEALVHAHIKLLETTTPARSKDNPDNWKLYLELRDARWTAMVCFSRKRLYLPHDLNEEIRSVIDSIALCESSFQLRVLDGKSHINDWELLGDLWDEAQGPIEARMREVEARLRQFVQSN